MYLLQHRSAFFRFLFLPPSRFLTLQVDLQLKYKEVRPIKVLGKNFRAHSANPGQPLPLAHRLKAVEPNASAPVRGGERAASGDCAMTSRHVTEMIIKWSPWEYKTLVLSHHRRGHITFLRIFFPAFSSVTAPTSSSRSSNKDGSGTYFYYLCIKCMRKPCFSEEHSATCGSRTFLFSRAIKLRSPSHGHWQYFTIVICTAVNFTPKHGIIVIITIVLIAL